MIHRGGCHCGNLRVSLRLTQSPREVRLRACGCSFCRAHNTRTASDPNGALDIWADDWSLVQLYRFGTGTAEFVICRKLRSLYRRDRGNSFRHPRRHQHDLPR
jgi:hypothetical protein